jgi:hypothetical protein
MVQTVVAQVAPQKRELDGWRGGGAADVRGRSAGGMSGAFPHERSARRRGEGGELTSPRTVGAFDVGGYVVGTGLGPENERAPNGT